MKFTLKALKVSRNLSHETLAFTATLHCDGKRVARVQGQGTGGAPFVAELFVPEHRVGTMNARLREYGPKLNGTTMPRYRDVAALAEGLAEQTTGRARMRRQAKRSLLFVHAPAISPAEILDLTSYQQLNAPDTSEARAWVLQRHPGVTFLNDLLPAEASVEC